MSYAFDREADGGLALQTAVYQALGTASVCWETPPTGARALGIFDEKLISEVAAALMVEIQNQNAKEVGRAFDSGYQTAKRILLAKGGTPTGWYDEVSKGGVRENG